MKRLITKYKQLSFEDKTIFTTQISILINATLAIGKIFLSIFRGVFFFIAGVVNIFIMIAKLECFLGVKQPEKKSFNYRNTMIGLFLMFAGMQYSLYMGRMIFADIEIMQYSITLGCCVAFVSFVEMGLAIRGCFLSFGKGHYYRNIKLINLCSALTALVLTEVALMSFASETDFKKESGIFGFIVGGIMILIAIFIFAAPKVSIVDREHNVYEKMNDEPDNDLNTTIHLPLTHSKLYGNYDYIATKNGNRIDGYIKKGKSPIRNFPILLKIFLIILSEILIFPYAIGAFIFYLKNCNIIKRLDQKMEEEGYKKVYECEDQV